MTDKLIALVSAFIEADDTLAAAGKSFKVCGQPFTRHSNMYVCGKEKAWHGYCESCQTAIINDRLNKQSKRRVQVSARNKALKELKNHWKEVYDGRK